MSLKAKIAAHRSLDVLWTFLSRSEYLQTGLQGHGTKVALSNSCTWNRDGLGMGQGEGADWEQLGQGTSPGIIYCWGQLGLCLSPCIQGLLQLPPAPWKSCSSYQVGVLLWFSVQWHMIYELCSLIYDLYGWQRRQDQPLGYCANSDDT